MKKQYICMPLIAILLFGCTIAPEKPDDGAALSPCGILPNCVNSDSGGGGSDMGANRSRVETLRNQLDAPKTNRFSADSDASLRE